LWVDETYHRVAYVDAMAGTCVYADETEYDLLDPRGGCGVMLAYAAITAVIGWLTTFRKDLT